MSLLDVQNLAIQNRSAEMQSKDPADQLKNMRKAAEQFESFFMSQIMEQAYKSIDKSEFSSGGSGEDMFQSMFMQEVSQQGASAGKGFGLADMIMDSMKKRYGMEELQSEFSTNNDARQHFFIMPSSGNKISSKFGLREHPIDNALRHHDGIDIAVPEGSPVKAAKAGEVIFSGERSGYGNTVVIRHANNYTSLYAHNADLMVKKGDMVQQGDIISLSGNTGKSTGPHLHFEIRKDGQPVDPEKMINFEKKT